MRVFCLVLFCVVQCFGATLCGEPFQDQVEQANATEGGQKRCALSVAAIFKNEGNYLKEWIEFHKLIGVSHFYLYNNGSNDNYAEVLEPYIRHGEVTLIEWPDRKTASWKNTTWAWVYTTQVAAYEDAIVRARGVSKWLAMIDIDEFLVPKREERLDTLLAQYEKTFPGIEVHWRIYGTAGYRRLPQNTLLIEALNKKACDTHPLNQSYKTILQPEAYTRFVWPPHKCHYIGNRNACPIGSDELVINHYMNRTIDDFYARKVPNKQHMDNCRYSKESLEQFLKVGNDIEDTEGHIRRFIPRLREKCNVRKKIVYIYPGAWGNLFNANDSIANRDGCLEPLIAFKKQAEAEGFELRQTYNLRNLDAFHRLIVFEVPINQLFYLMQYPKERCVAFLWEPPSVLPTNYMPKHHQVFSKVFTWNDALVDNRKYFKFNYPVCKPMIQNVKPFSQKKFTTLIACNKQSSHPEELYTARRRLIKYFASEAKDLFDLYGRGWALQTPNYKGAVAQKIACLPNYRFCFAYENMADIPGYITEKIFDAFHAGCVPVYWGASNVTEYIPEDCFIDARKFPDEKSLHHYLKNMNKKTYENYICNINRFLQSERSYAFTRECFVARMMAILRGEL